MPSLWLHDWIGRRGRCKYTCIALSSFQEDPFKKPHVFSIHEMICIAFLKRRLPDFCSSDAHLFGFTTGSEEEEEAARIPALH